MSTPHNDAAFEGEQILHYQVEDRLGAGGMGVVFKALDLRLKRRVALKFLAPDLRLDANHRERLLREAAAASALDHPNIGAVHALEATPDGRIFIVMAFYPGGTLKDRLEHGWLGNAEAVDIVLQAARGLAVAHAHGIIHRDIKPSNLILTPEGVVKIVDFGLAKISGGSDLTQTGTAVGTAAFMSPEQATSTAIDRRTDIWSLGVVLYQMLRGSLPFHGDTAIALLYQVVHVEYPPLTGKPPALQKIVGKCLGKKPEDRYATAEELVHDLENFRVSLAAGESAETVSIPVAPAHAFQTPAFRTLDTAAPSRISPRWAAVLVVLVLAGSLWLWMSIRKPPPPPVQSTTAAPVSAPVAVRPPPAEQPPAVSTPPQVAQKSGPKGEKIAGRGAIASVYTGPKEGKILWTGDLDAGQTLDLGGKTTVGNVTGSLPGVPVTLGEIHPPNMIVVTPPGPGNEWRGLVLRNEGKHQAIVTVYWSVKSP